MKFTTRLVAVLFLWILPGSETRLLAGAEEKYQKFTEENAEFIFEKAHPKSTYKSSTVKIINLKSEKADFRVVLKIKYKGWVKSHQMTCHIYFKQGPVDFKWVSDTNTISPTASDGEVLEALMDLWEEENN